MPLSAYVESALFLSLAGVALFVPAGTLAVPVFWFYLAILAGVSVASFALPSPSLIRERMRPGGRRPSLGKRLLRISPPPFWIVAGLDRGRLHWSDGVPPWLQAGGLVAVACGFALFFWAMAVNPFFSSVARIQAERGQHVITAGPYRWVRHPGYSGSILLSLASGIALGSWLAAATAVILGMPLILYRTITEDRLLQAELPDYHGYAGRVPWRLMPGLW
jgi:protein-S-isoprenylcysteine O-methyltransferase Ste14